MFFLLERAGFDCLLYQASQVKALPGRPKTGKLDSAWLARITEQGSLAGSFVPPEEIRRLRTHTRYRRRLIQARTAEKERCEKLLEDAHLKLSSVISDIHGVSGRAMLRALVAGQEDPEALAELAQKRLRAKLPELKLALHGRVTDHHRFLLRVLLEQLEALEKGIAQVRVGGRISDIGHAIQQHVEAHGFSVVREFVGHGIGASLHEEPQIANYGEPGRGPRLAEGMTLAIEPMVNVGKPAVKVLNDGWTAVTRDGTLSAHFEHTVVVTATGCRILTRTDQKAVQSAGAPLEAAP